MATKRVPASFGTPNKLELRPFQQALDNIREQLQAHERLIANVGAQAGVNTQTAAGSNSGLAALRAEIAALSARIDALPTGGGGGGGGGGTTIAGLMTIFEDGEPGEDGFPVPGNSGAQGPIGTAGAGTPGPPVLIFWDESEDSDGGPPGPPGPIGQTGATGSGGSGGGVLNPDSYPATPNAADDEFEYSTGLDTTGARRGGATAWTWLTASATNVIADGALIVTPPVSSTVRAFDMPVSGATFKYRVKFAVLHPGDTSQLMQGMYFRNSANAKCLSLMRLLQTGPTKQVEFDRWTNMTTPTFSAAVTTVTHSQDDHGEFKGWMWIELEYDGTSVIGRTVRNGYTQGQRTITTEAVATFLGGAPTHVGLFFSNTTAITQNMGADWFRKIA